MLNKIKEHEQRMKGVDFNLTTLEMAYVSYFSRMVKRENGRIYDNEIKYEQLPYNYDTSIRQSLGLTENEYQEIKYGAKLKGYLSYERSGIFLNKDLTTTEKVQAGQPIF